jgi:hypothetical protein
MYGVDYDAIIVHLGSCPGKMAEYQVDHILPLAAFDLTESWQVKAAFAPENHRWCLKQDNLVKNAQFNQQELVEYLKKWSQL